MEGGAPGAARLGGQLLTALAAGIDGIVLRTARAVIDATLMPGPDDAEALRAGARFYAGAPFATDPRRFFAFLDRPEPVPAVTLVPRRLRHPGSERLHLTFRSPYRPANPAFAAEHARQTENQLVHADVWRHPGSGARATVVALHGFGMGHPVLDAAALMTPALFAAGLDVVLPTLPLHGARSPRTARFSGQLFASPDVVQLNEAIGQAVHDTSALVAWLRSRGAGPVGVLGLSLGGYVAALMASLTDDLAFAIPVIAPVCFGDLAHRFMAASARYRHRPDAALGREEFRAAYRVHSPLAHARRMPRERLMIVAGEGDRVIPPEHPLWLWRHWGEPRLAWFGGGHLVPFGRARVVGEVRRFLRELSVV
jgi:pimeloyl-ACP methyl ester carboxylesterase